MITTQARGAVVRNLGRADRYTKQHEWHDMWESPTWLDSPAFLLYACEIAKILVNSADPLCTREIHDALGDIANPRWTMDALEAVRNLGKVERGLVTRYFIIQTELPQPAKLDQDAEHDRIFEN